MVLAYLEHLAQLALQSGRSQAQLANANHIQRTLEVLGDGLGSQSLDKSQAWISRVGLGAVTRWSLLTLPVPGVPCRAMISPFPLPAITS